MPQFKLSSHPYRGWLFTEFGAATFTSDHMFEIFGERIPIENKEDWNSDNFTKLAIYNLHYLNDLISENSVERYSEKNEILHKWIADNPIGEGVGWDSYPISIRIVNIIKYFLNGADADKAIINSVALQAEYLSKNLEYHLLGNHLFVNAKALIFAGCFFDGVCAEKWLILGEKLLLKEIDEQILGDGGHFERSPMYHSLILVDMLDLVNLSNVYTTKFSNNLIEKLRSNIPKMNEFLMDMSHLDGGISFFNDSVFGVAPENFKVFDYAKQLGFNVPLKRNSPYLKDYQDSGYIAYHTDDISFIADLAEIGPSYIPGHAHADTFSFEMSIGASRVFVNSGVSTYEVNEQRLEQRKTAAHNCITINGLDSSQVWSSFRVAKRASIAEKYVNFKDGEFSAVHDGFVKQGVKCLHKRSWKIFESNISVTDEFIGDYLFAEGFLHIHPDVAIQAVSDTEFKLDLPNYRVLVSINGGSGFVCNSFWYPQFNQSLPSKKIRLESRHANMQTHIFWERK